jgi:hypothetical protein
MHYLQLWIGVPRRMQVFKNSFLENVSFSLKNYVRHPLRVVMISWIPFSVAIVVLSHKRIIMTRFIQDALLFSTNVLGLVAYFTLPRYEAHTKFTESCRVPLRNPIFHPCNEYRSLDTWKYMEPTCVVLVIDDNLYWIMFVLIYTCRIYP